jgi:hypothetical protein
VRSCNHYNSKNHPKLRAEESHERSDDRAAGFPTAAANARRRVQVVLISDRFRDRRDLLKTATTDQNGDFTLRGIAPGDYKLFAWEEIEPFSYYDPEVLRRYEEQGRSIKVSESAKVTVEAKMIPAGQ